MPYVAIGYGIILALMGVVAYFASGRASVTALIPTFIGTPVILLGLLALKERFLKHAMHGVALIALLALFGTIRSLPSLPAALGGGDVERPTAVIVQGVTALLSIAMIAFSVRSFIAARRAKAQGGAA